MAPSRRSKNNGQMLRRLSLVLVGLLLLSLTSAGRQAHAQEGGNLLRNPGFEDGFFKWNGINEINVAHEWTPWWADDPNHDPTYLTPEFKEALARDFPYRVRTGERAQQWFKLYSSFLAGVHQQVFDVTPGQNYQFSIWAQVWSSTEDNPATVSTLPGDPHLRIGIDPTGHWDPFSPNIVWSAEARMDQVIDRYGMLTVEATAQNSIITVFVRSSPEFANKHNNIYLDDAVLAQVGPSPSPPTSTAPPPTATLPDTQTPAPTDTPTPTATPPPTATLSNTETPAPTDTPAPTVTSPTTDTPTPTATPLPTESSPPPSPTSPEGIESATRPATPAQEVSVTEPTTPPTNPAEQVEEPATIAPEQTDDEGSLNLCAAPALALAFVGLAYRRRRNG